MIIKNEDKIQEINVIIPSYLNQFGISDEQNEKSEERTNNLIKWLKKIKKKYNYDETYSKNY